MISAAALFSGGKDSVYSLFIAQQQQIFDIGSTVTMLPAASDSYMFHVPNVGLAPVVSSAMGVSNRTFEVEDGEDELAALSRAIESLGVDAVITGAIASDYQAFRINMVCEPLGVRVFSPLWHKDQEMLLRDMIDAGFVIAMIGVSAEGLDESWLGRTIDPAAVDGLVALSRRRKINIGGEGGEYESIVLDGPNFDKRLRIVSSERNWRKDSGYLSINALGLESKVQCE